MLFVHCTICSTKHNPPKDCKIYRRKKLFSIVIGFQSPNENEFLGSGNVVVGLWKSFRNFLKEFLRTLATIITIISRVSPHPPSPSLAL